MDTVSIDGESQSALRSKTRMSQRRPLLMSGFENGPSVTTSFSYFSEKVGKEQDLRSATISKVYKPNFGIYQFCKATIIQKQVFSESIKDVLCCEFSPDGQMLVVGFGNGTLHVHHVLTKTSDAILPHGVPQKITSVKFLPNSSCIDKFLSACLAGNIYLTELTNDDSWECHTLFHENRNEIYTMDTSYMSTFLATAGKDANIRLYDINSKKLLRMFNRGNLSNEEATAATLEEGHFKRICSLKFSKADPNVFITGGWGNHIKVWDVRCPAGLVRGIYGFHITGDSLDISERDILCGEWTFKDSLHILDLGSMKIKTHINPSNRSIPYFGEFINSARFMRNPTNSPGEMTLPRGDLIIVAGWGTCAMEVISIEENMVLHAAGEKHSVCAVDQHEDMIAFGGGSQAYTILSFMPRVSQIPIKSKSIHDSNIDHVTNKDSLSIDLAWNTILSNYAIEQEARKKYVLSEEERFMDSFLKEIKEQSLPGPNNIIGSKLRRYLRRLGADSDFSAREKFNILDHDSEQRNLRTFHFTPNYKRRGINEANKQYLHNNNN